MKRNDIHTYEKLAAQLLSFHQEMSSLARKSPNDAINPFKLKFINKTIEKCNKFLGRNYRPFADFEGFQSDEIPSNSDVTFILSQYIECTEKYRADNIYHYYGKWCWKIDNVDPENKEKQIVTFPPKKLTRK